MEHNGDPCHGPQVLADILAKHSMPPEIPGAPRPSPTPLPALWEAMCKGNLENDWENIIAMVRAACGAMGSNGEFLRVSEGQQYRHGERLRRTANALTGFFDELGWPAGTERSIGAIFATVLSYMEDAQSTDPNAVERMMRSTVLNALRERSVVLKVVLGLGDPCAIISPDFIVPNSSAIAARANQHDTHTHTPHTNDITSGHPGQQ